MSSRAENRGMELELNALRRSADELAWRIDADGITAHETAVAQLSSTARRVGVRGVALNVLADNAQASVARERAFGLVAMQLAVVERRSPVASAA
jgi:hypothetical protein